MTKQTKPRAKATGPGECAWPEYREPAVERGHLCAPHEAYWAHVSASETLGKRGPRPRGSPRPATLEAMGTTDGRERPPVPRNRLVLAEVQAAKFLKMSRTTFRKRAAAGEFPRYGMRGGYRYSVYDLLDWLMDQRQGG